MIDNAKNAAMTESPKSKDIPVAGTREFHFREDGFEPQTIIAKTGEEAEAQWNKIKKAIK